MTLQYSGRDGWELLSEAVTDDDGRVGGFGEVHAGTYQITFDLGEHLGPEGFYPRASVVFRLSGDEHHHIPLLISPHGYTTYRGS